MLVKHHPAQRTQAAAYTAAKGVHKIWAACTVLTCSKADDGETADRHEEGKRKATNCQAADSSMTVSSINSRENSSASHSCSRKQQHNNNDNQSL
jgi:hypothetical protein